MYDDQRLKNITRILLTSVLKLHKKGIVHRDIKHNIIYDEDDQTLQLVDHGTSVPFVYDVEVTGRIGTPAYMAPEVCNGGEYNQLADIWSIGCTVLEMATGLPPWHEYADTYSIVWKVSNGIAPVVPDTLSDQCQDFLSRCFQPKQSRWSAEQLLSHPFLVA